MANGTLKDLPISKLFPNMVTILGLCAGLSAIRFALLERWELAVTFIVIAAFIDGVDGRLARLLNSTSRFGAELDSLSDFVNFGVTPAFVLYLWSVDEIGIRGLGWSLTLFFIICMAIRLARFNTTLEDGEKPEWADNFFSGIPAPSSAGLSIVPMMLSFQLGDGFYSDPRFVAIYMTGIALFTASSVPTFSSKKIRIRRNLVSVALLIAAIFFIGLLIEPWITLPLMGAVYIASIPFSVAYYYKLSSGSHTPIEKDLQA